MIDIAPIYRLVYELGKVRRVLNRTIEQDDDVIAPPDETARGGAPNGLPRHTRRLSDKVLVAFHHACDTADLEIAEHLLNILEIMLTRRPIHADGNRRRSIEGLVAAHERLWHLRHPAVEQ